MATLSPSRSFSASLGAPLHSSLNQPTWARPFGKSAISMKTTTYLRVALLLLWVGLGLFNVISPQLGGH
jgi:hypothetical protein